MTRMRDIWILGEKEEFKSRTDTATVRQLQTLIPKISSDNRTQIQSLMDQRKIFPQVTCPEDQHALLDHLLKVGGRILSFHTLRYDCRYLQSCSELLQELLPPFR